MSNYSYIPLLSSSIMQYSKDKFLPILICDTCQKAVTFVAKFHQLIMDSEIFLQHYMQDINNGEIIHPGLNGCPGIFQPPKDCVITIINPEEETLTTNDEFSSDDSADDNNITLSTQCKTFSGIKQSAKDNIEDEENVNASVIYKSLIEGTNLEDNSPNQTKIEEEATNSMVNILTKSEDNRLSLSTKNKKIKLLCQYCDTAFYSADLHYEHEMEHGVQAPYVCYVCRLRFNNMQTMIKHIKTKHDAQRPFFCFICGKKFSLRAGLKKHVVVHLNAERFTCTKCGKDFSRNTNLLKHLQVHRNAQQLDNIDELEEFSDGHSAMEYATVDKIQTMPKSTSSHRSHNCEICGKTFTREKDLSRHKAIHLDTLFNCKICGERFNRREKLLRHEKEIHTPMKKYSCKKCAAEFDEVGGLQRHEAMAHDHGASLWNTSSGYSPQIATVKNHLVSNVDDDLHYSFSRTRFHSIQANEHPNQSMCAINLGFYSETNINNQNI